MGSKYDLGAVGLEIGPRSKLNYTVPGIAMAVMG